ncbi:MAG: metallophosphoesterase [Prevotella sp.]|nr:metallophosphoesterase [Prevotella sp.]
MWMIIFLLLPFLGLAYIGWHVWTLVPLPAVWRITLIILGVASFLLIFANFGRATDKLPLPLARLVYDVGNSSVFVLLYLVIIFLLLDLGRLVRLIRPEWLHQNFAISACIAIGLFVLFLYGNTHYYNKARVELHLTSDKPLAKPMKLVMLSDLHLGYHNPRRELARWVDMINQEKPDVVLIAGDIIDGSMRPLVEENMAEEMRRIEAPVYACLGNHEYYTGEPRAQQFYRDANIHLLRDTFALVGDLCIIGRDDRTNLHRKSVVQLKSQISARLNGTLSSERNLKSQTSKYSILLDHQPYHLERTERAGIDFQLSGHTHYGQVWPISWITKRIYECAYGPYQLGKTRYYVSSGMGIWGGKYRIGTRSEYVVATLE